MDRDAHVRAARRRQALDALAFEQDREALLVEELEDLLAQVEGSRLDDDLLAQLDRGDAELVRGALGLAVLGAAMGVELDLEPDEDDPDDEPGDDPADDFAFPVEFDLVGADPDEEGPEAEISRLQGEIRSSRRIQAALERYLELLSAQPSPP